MKAWIFLLTAGILEIVWAVGIKYTEGFTRIVPTVITGIAMVFSIYFLSQAIKVLPLGTAYAIWTGIGAAGTFILGMVLFDEPRDIARIICVLFIIIGIVGLKFLHGR